MCVERWNESSEVYMNDYFVQRVNKSLTGWTDSMGTDRTE